MKKSKKKVLGVFSKFVEGGHGFFILLNGPCEKKNKEIQKVCRVYSEFTLKASSVDEVL